MISMKTVRITVMNGHQLLMPTIHLMEHLFMAMAIICIIHRCVADPMMEDTETSITTSKYIDLLSSSPSVMDDQAESSFQKIEMGEYPGDIMLGAIFPVHQHETVNHTCGVIHTEGIQQLEAMIYVLDRINNDPNILPGIRLGALAIDSCDSPHHALEQSIDFVKSFAARLNRRLLHPEYHCQDHSAPIYKNGKFDHIVGIIGGQSSEVSLQLANLLRLFRVPQISYMSTSPTLSDERIYQYFFRTVPSDTNQVDAIVDILRKFNWTYVSVVYSDTEYGNNGYDLLTTAAARYNICISSPQAINVERFRLADYDNLITTLMHKINARVVIVYTDPHVARKIMKAARRRLGPLGRLDRFVWIASDAWCCREFVVHGLEPVVEGTISVTPLHYPLEGFADYFGHLQPEDAHYRSNPWFPEFWEHHFKCRLPSFSTMMDGGSSTMDNSDSESESKESGTSEMQACNQSLLLDVDDLQQSPSLHFVRDAFFAFAMTLHNIQRSVCNGTGGLCGRMKELIFNGHYIIEQLKQVEFRDEGGRMFRFQPNGDGLPRYTIVNFQRSPNGTYQWRPVGTYMVENENENKARLNLEIDLLKFKDEPQDRQRFPKSFCSEPCSIGQAKLQLEGDTCCWLCTNCSQYQYLVDEFHCEECPLGTLPNRNKSECYPVPTIYLSLTEWWTISSMIFASAGMMATICTWFVFFYYSETPIIKASGRELSNLHLAGIFLSFAVTFVIVSKPTPFTCAMTRFLLGFCYTVCYSAIVTKTNRIARIFQHRSCQKPKFTSPRSQLVITSLLISIEIVINIIWFFYMPPGIKMVYNSREIALLICSGSDHLTYLFGLIYPLILIGFCTVYAFKTRKCPEGFNEARYITFTNYTTCVVWFAFLPLYVMLSTTTPLRAITLSSLLSVSGAVQLCCLFVPKMYIALLKPEKNTRETVMCGGTLHRSLVFSQNMSSFYHHHHHHYHHHHHHQTRQHNGSLNSRPVDCSSRNEACGGHHNDILSTRAISQCPAMSKSSAAVVMLEPYSTSSEVDTTYTNATTSNNQINNCNNKNCKSGSIVSMPDVKTTPFLSPSIVNNPSTNDNDNTSTISTTNHPPNDGSSGHYQQDKIIESSSSSNASTLMQIRRPLSAGAAISSTNSSNNNGNRMSINKNSSTLSASSTTSKTINAVHVVGGKGSLSLSSSSTPSSCSSSPSPPTPTSSVVIKHETKAVLENGHQCWPSIRLDGNSSTNATNNNSTATKKSE